MFSKESQEKAVRVKLLRCGALPGLTLPGLTLRGEPDSDLPGNRRAGRALP